MVVVQPKDPDSKRSKVDKLRLKIAEVSAQSTQLPRQLMLPVMLQEFEYQLEQIVERSTALLMEKIGEVLSLPHSGA